MAEKLETLYVELRAENKGLKKDINGLRKHTDKQAKKMGKSFGTSFAKGFAALGGLLAIKKALDFSIAAKNAARDAKEISDKFNTVFSSISKKANSAASDFSKAFKIASSTAKELLGNTGDLLVGFGFAEDAALDLATQVNTLAQDLASFTNYSGGASGASAALTKALLGETESAKSLGIVIRQNTAEFREQVKEVAKAKGLTSQQAKAVVILKQAYSQSTKAVGDFSRTQSSLANQERILNEQFKEMQERLGNAVVPLFLKLVQAGSGWLTILEKITGMQKEFALSTGQLDTTMENLKGTTKEWREKELDRLKREISNIIGVLHVLGKRNKLVASLFPTGTEASLKAYLANLEAQSGAIVNFRNQPGGGGGEKKGVVRGLNSTENISNWIDNMYKYSRPDLMRGDRSTDPINTGRGGSWPEAKDDAGANAAGQRIGEYLEDGAETFEDKMLSGVSSFGNLLTSTLGLAADGFVGALTDGIAIISQLLGIASNFMPGGGSVLSLLFGHKGGTFEGGNKIASFASGGDFMVPGGYNNDSFPMMVESGERVQVTPSNKVGQESKMLAKVYSAIQALNMNFVEKDFAVTVVNQSDIKSQVLKGKSVENDFNKTGVNLNEL